MAIKKTGDHTWKRGMLKKLKEEESINSWSLQLQKKARKGRFAAIKRKDKHLLIKSKSPKPI